MRWPFPRNRRRPTASVASPEERGAWRRLPPLRRTVPTPATTLSDGSELPAVRADRALLDRPVSYPEAPEPPIGRAVGIALVSGAPPVAPGSGGSVRRRSPARIGTGHRAARVIRPGSTARADDRQIPLTLALGRRVGDPRVPVEPDGPDLVWQDLPREPEILPEPLSEPTSWSRGPEHLFWPEPEPEPAEPTPVPRRASLAESRRLGYDLRGRRPPRSEAQLSSTDGLVANGNTGVDDLGSESEPTDSRNPTVDHSTRVDQSPWSEAAELPDDEPPPARRRAGLAESRRLGYDIRGRRVPSPAAEPPQPVTPVDTTTGPDTGSAVLSSNTDTDAEAMPDPTDSDAAPGEPVVPFDAPAESQANASEPITLDTSPDEPEPARRRPAPYNPSALDAYSSQPEGDLFTPYDGAGRSGRVAADRVGTASEQPTPSPARVEPGPSTSDAVLGGSDDPVRFTTGDARRGSESVPSDGPEDGPGLYESSVGPSEAETLTSHRAQGGPTPASPADDQDEAGRPVPADAPGDVEAFTSDAIGSDPGTPGPGSMPGAPVALGSDARQGRPTTSYLVPGEDAVPVGSESSGSSTVPFGADPNASEPTAPDPIASDPIAPNPVVPDGANRPSRTGPVAEAAAVRAEPGRSDLSASDAGPGDLGLSASSHAPGEPATSAAPAADETTTPLVGSAAIGAVSAESGSTASSATPAESGLTTNGSPDAAGWSTSDLANRRTSDVDPARSESAEPSAVPADPSTAPLNTTSDSNRPGISHAALDGYETTAGNHVGDHPDSADNSIRSRADGLGDVPVDEGFTVFPPRGPEVIATTASADPTARPEDDVMRQALNAPAPPGSTVAESTSALEKPVLRHRPSPAEYPAPAAPVPDRPAGLTEPATESAQGAGPDLRRAETGTAEAIAPEPDGQGHGPAAAPGQAGESLLPRVGEAQRRPRSTPSTDGADALPESPVATDSRRTGDESVVPPSDAGAGGMRPLSPAYVVETKQPSTYRSRIDHQTVATAPPAAAGVRLDRPVLRASAVPPSLAERFRAMNLPDVAQVPVLRGSEPTERARDLGARGFTHGGAVFLPGDAAEQEPLLGHELVHAVQQHSLGRAVPAEDSPEGHRLEAEALAVEGWIAGQLPDPPALSYPGSFGPAPTGSWPAEPTSTPVVQRAAITPAPGSGLPSGSGPVIEPGEQLPANSLAAALMATAGVPQPNDVPQPAQAQRDDRGGEEAADRIAGEVARLLGADPPRRWVDMDSSYDLEEISKRLYDRLHRRLRFDLLVERERSGSLMDFR